MSESSGSINVQQIIEQITGGTVIGVQQIISQLNAQEKRNRQIMLQKVREFWVEGVLEKSLHREVLIELGIQAQKEAVIRENPWSMIVQQAGQPDFEIPPGADISGIAEVFDRSGRALLILGAPGSGKTTTMLTLARDLISRAQADETHAIPVVFNLSSWANERKFLAEWLKDELFLRYQVPRKVAAAWVEGDFVLPLLDGLDEVSAENRNECVEAINKFRTEHDFTDVVVCSRVADYEALTSKLKLGGAVTLQALTHEQIEAYLANLGKTASILRNSLTPRLLELAETPLMLSVMIVAFNNLPPDAAVFPFRLGQVRFIDSKKHIFEFYVKYMFERRGKAEAYPQEQTLHWLSWLARKLVENKQSVFYIESLQPSWLEKQSKLAYGRIVLLVYGLIYALIGGLLGRLIDDRAFYLLGLSIGLVYGLRKGKNVEKKHSSRLRKRYMMLDSRLIYMLFGGLYGIICGLVFGIIVGSSWGLSGLIGGLIFGLVIGLVYGLRFAGYPVSIQHIIQPVFLRLILWRAGYAPLNYARFLDTCAERVILRKVGGGYIFIHGLLMEYFAGLNVTKE